MRRESLKLPDEDWLSLQQLAKQFGATYRGKPSWRCLIRFIARGDVQVGGNPPPYRPAQAARVRKVASAGGLARPGGMASPVAVNTALVSRNAPCPCGSGLKFKRCCGAR